jgi:hypothetical protein
VAPENERPSPWGNPAPFFGGRPGPSGYESSESPAHETPPEPQAFESRPESPAYENRPRSPDGSAGPGPQENVDWIGDGHADPSGYQDPDLSGHENPGLRDEVTARGISGESTTPTRLPLSPNGARTAGGGHAPSKDWPLGFGHATVTKRREHRILRGVRSGVALAVIALALGVAAAASLGVIVWLIATAIHHAASN